MPYKAKGKCVYKKDTGKKVGCTKGDVKKYLAALHMNTDESVKKESINELKKEIRKILFETISEGKNKKMDVSDEIHLPELTMKKKDLIEHLKNLYNLEVKER